MRKFMPKKMEKTDRNNESKKVKLNSTKKDENDIIRSPRLSFYLKFEMKKQKQFNSAFLKLRLDSTRQNNGIL